VKSVKLYDPSPVESHDLGAQFYLEQNDIGKPTATACKAKLHELNTAVMVSVLDAISNEDLLAVQACSCRPALPIAVLTICRLSPARYVFVTRLCCQVSTVPVRHP
jgi:ThiF family